MVSLAGIVFDPAAGSFNLTGGSVSVSNAGIVNNSSLMPGQGINFCNLALPGGRTIVSRGGCGQGQTGNLISFAPGASLTLPSNVLTFNAGPLANGVNILNGNLTQSAGQGITFTSTGLGGTQSYSTINLTGANVIPGSIVIQPGVAVFVQSPGALGGGGAVTVQGASSGSGGALILQNGVNLTNAVTISGTGVANFNGQSGKNSGAVRGGSGVNGAAATDTVSGPITVSSNATTGAQIVAGGSNTPSMRRAIPSSRRSGCATTRSPSGASPRAVPIRST